MAQANIGDSSPSDYIHPTKYNISELRMIFIDESTLQTNHSFSENSTLQCAACLCQRHNKQQLISFMLDHFNENPSKKALTPIEILYTSCWFTGEKCVFVRACRIAFRGTSSMYKSMTQHMSGWFGLRDEMAVGIGLS